MGFHEVRFPANLGFGSTGGPQRRTDIVTLANGFEERNTPWAQSLHHYDAGLGLRSLDDVQALIAFFEARGGQLYGFRWKDWADWKSCLPSADPAPTDQVIGTGDGVSRVFALAKTYLSGEQSYTRVIAKPVAGSVLAAVQGQSAADVAEMDVAEALAPFDLKNQLSSNRTQGVPNMIALIKEHAARLAEGARE